MSWSQQIPLLIFLPPFIAALILPLFRKSYGLLRGFTLASLALSFAASVQGLLSLPENGALRYKMGGWAPPFGIEWMLDGLALVMTCLVAGIGFLSILATYQTAPKEIKGSQTAYHMILSLHIASLLGMIMTHDFFNLFVFLEVASLTGYALIASGDAKRGNVASFKYLLIGTVGAVFYLLGVGYLYAATGSLNMSDIAAKLPALLESRTILLGVFLIAIGFAIKMGLFPFHGWLPDAYTYAATATSSFIAPIMTKVAIYAIARIFFWAFGIEVVNHYKLFHIFAILGCAAVVFGSLLAFFQTQWKRMHAYSSVSQIGLIIIAFCIQHPIAYIGAVLHMIFHAVMKGLLFLTADAAENKLGVVKVEDLSKLKGRMPRTLGVMAIGSLSMIGIPPLCGFFSKWLILLGAFKTGQYWLLGCVLFSSLLSALYLFKVIEIAFFHKKEEGTEVQEAPFSLTIGMLVMAGLVISLGFFSPFFYSWAQSHLVQGIF